MDLALVGLALGAEPVPTWDLLLPDYGFRDSDLVNNSRVHLAQDSTSCLEASVSWFHGFMVSWLRIVVAGATISTIQRVAQIWFRVQGSGFRV